MEKVAAEALEHLLYTTSKPTEKSHRCAVVINKKYAASYFHGSHSSFMEGQKTILYNVCKPSLEIEVTVSVVSERNDFVIFETVNGEFPHYPHNIYSLYPGQRYLQLGVNQKREPTWKEGIVSKMGAGFFLGSSHGEYGDSGSGIFNMTGCFIGISVAKKQFVFSNLQIAGSTINYEELAVHHPETKIVGVDVMMAFLPIDDPDFPPPPEKKHASGME